MGFNNFYPYTDFNELNLDWILRTIKELTKSLTDFEAFNKITWQGDWNIGNYYPQWSLVNDLEGNGYIAVKPVPRNVPIDNREYWKPVANYDALYAEFEQRISNLENSVDDINDTLVTVNNDINDINGNIGNLTNLNTTNKSSIVDAVNEVYNNTLFYQTKNIIFVSDSYGLNRNNNNGVGYYLENLIRNGDTLYRWCAGSIGIATVGDGGYTAKTLMQARESLIDNPDEITDVVIAMGANDIANATKTQIVDASVELSNYIKATYPNAKQWLSFYGLIESMNTATYAMYLESVDAYRRASGYTYFKYMSNLEYIMHNHNHFQADGVHPTTEGCLQLARGLCGWIYNDGYDYLFETIESYSDGGLTGSFKITINNGITTIALSEYGGTKSMSLSASLTIVGKSLNTVKGFSGNGIVTLIPMYGVSGFPCVSLIMAGANMYMQIPSASTVAVTAITCKLATINADTLTV